jgi:hypothetical protein
LQVYARVAGLFILLFAQPLSRICRMNPEQVTIRDDANHRRPVGDPRRPGLESVHRDAPRLRRRRPQRLMRNKRPAKGVKY